MFTYNIYMEEAAADGLNGDTDLEVTFRVVPDQDDQGLPEENAIIVGLDMVDLMNLRDSLQLALDDFNMMAYEAVVLGNSEETEDPQA